MLLASAAVARSAESARKAARPFAGPQRGEVVTAGNSISLPITIAGVIETKKDAGGDRVELADFAVGGAPGDPELPLCRMCFLLPPDVDYKTLTVTLENAVWEDQAGQFDIAPVPPAAYGDGSKDISWSGKNPANIIAGRDVAIYAAAASFPANPVTTIEPSKYRQWNLVYVSMVPVAHNPVRKSLRLLRSGTIAIRFARDGQADVNGAGVPARTEQFWARLSPRIENPGDRAAFYPAEAAAVNGAGIEAVGDPDYIIITTNNIVANSTKLDDFIAHKRLVGHTVSVITEAAAADNTHYATGATTDTRANNIRAWLLAGTPDRYISWGIDYVLLIGDPEPSHWDPAIGIPMKLCYPNAAKHGAGEEVPTDVFFAEFPGNWDRDGDGFFGEWMDDWGGGGIDRDCDVCLGRIPYYGNIGALDGILNKIITYESATTDQPWRRKILIPASISNHSPEDRDHDGDAVNPEPDVPANRTFGTEWGEAVKSLATANGYTPYTLYEKLGCYADGSAYPLTACNATLTSAHVVAEWQNHYGFVTWWGHGSATGVFRRVWWGDRYFLPSDHITQHPEETSTVLFMSSNYCGNLSNDYPSIVFQGSCNNATPEHSGNLSYVLLKEGALAAIGSTRVSVYLRGAWTPARINEGDNITYGYYIPERMIVHNENLSEALNWCRANFTAGIGYDYWRNVLDFNIYGDPEATQNLIDLCPAVDLITRWDSSPTNAASVTFVVVFTETVSGVDSSDFVLTCSGVTGASITNVSPAGPDIVYAVTVNTGSGDGTIRLDLNDNDTIRDAASKPLGGPGADNGDFTTGDGYTINKSRPTVTVEQAATQEDPTNDDAIQFDVDFSEPVTGFTQSDVTMGGTATGVTFYTNIYSPTFVGIFVTDVATDGTVIPGIGANKVLDAAGNSNTASTSTDNIVTLDRARPTVTVNQESGQTDLTRSLPIRFSVRFSEPVIGFSFSDVAFTGTAAGVAGSLVGSGSSYTIVVTAATSDGIIIPSIPALRATDAANNLNLASTSTDNQVTLDRVAPTVTVEQMVGQPDPTNVFPIDFQVDFSEPVVGFTTSDVTMGGTAVGEVFTTFYSGGHYFIEVTAASNDGTLIPSIAASRCTDLAGNANAASTSTDNSVTLDHVGPQVTIAQAVGQSDPTNSFPVRFSVTFTESVTGFTASDLVWTGTAGAPTAGLTGSGSSYTISVTACGSDGTLIPTIPAGRAQDAGGNPNQASVSPLDGSVTLDRAAPTVAVNQMPGQNDPTRSFPIVFKAEFNEGVTGFTSGDVTIGGSATGVTFTFSQIGNTYFVEVTGATGDGTIIPSVAAARCTDMAGNANSASTSGDNSVTLDRVAPTVTVNQAAGQADPTNALPVVFDVHFSESVSNFVTNDVFMGGTATGRTYNVSGSGTDYTINVTNVTGDGTLVPTIAAGRATDAAGNPNTGSTSTDNSVRVDMYDPLVTAMVRMDTNPTSAGLVRFTVGFNEPVTGVGTSDFLLSHGGVAGISLGSVTGSGTTYTVEVNTGSGSGWIQLMLYDDDSIRDQADNRLGGTGTGNGNYSDDLYDIDRWVPTVSSITALDQNPTSASMVRFRIDFSEAVRSVDAGDLRITSSGVVGASIIATTGSGAVWTVSVNTGTSGGTVRLDVADNDSVRDEAGNPLGGVGAGNGNFTAGDSYEIDRTWPRVLSIVRSDASPTNASVVNYEVNFSEPVTGVTVSDFWLSVTGTLAGTTVTGVGSAPGQDVWYVSVNTGTGNGILQLRARDDDSIRDVADNRLGGTGAGNGNFNTGQSYTIDKTPPAVSSITRLSGNPTAAAEVRYRIRFNESVEGVWWNNLDLETSGSVSGAFVSEFHGSGPSWTVTVETGTGEGTIRLDVLDNDGIYDAATNPLGGPGAGNGNFSGPTYTVDRTPPSVVASTLAGASPTSAASVLFTVQFSEVAKGVGVADFALTVTGGVTGATIAGVSPSGTARTVTVNTGSGEGTIRLDVVDDDSIVDQAYNPLGGAGAGNGSFTGGQAYTIDKTRPSATINQSPGQADPANVLPVRFAVQFSESVNGFAVGDLSFAGTAAGLTYGISGAGSSYTVSVTAVTTDGTIIPSVISGRAADAAGNGNLGSSSTDNSVRLDRQIPSVVSVVRSDANPTSAGTVRFAVTFSEPVAGVGAGDFVLTATGGLSGASVSAISGSGTAARTVTVSTGSGDGSLRLDVADDDTITDAAGNPLGGPGAGNGGYQAGQSYTIDKTGPTCATPTDAGEFSSATTVAFSWTAGSDGGGCGIARYTLQVGTSPAASDVLAADVGLATSRSVTCGNGQRLYARLRAGDAVGNLGNFSASSDGILIDTVAPDTRVTSPAGTVTQTVFRVAFTASEGGSGLRGVRLFYRRNGTGAYLACGVAVTTSPITVDAALLGGNGAYEFYTVGTDRAGNAESAPASADLSITVNATSLARHWWLY